MEARGITEWKPRATYILNLALGNFIHTPTKISGRMVVLSFTADITSEGAEQKYSVLTRESAANPV